MRLVYVALGSKWNFMKIEGKWSAEQRVLSSLARLHDMHPDCVFVMPSLQNYDILHMLEDGADPDAHTWDVWRSRGIALLRKCDEMWVLTFPGWEDSYSVTKERSLCETMQIPVKYI